MDASMLYHDKPHLMTEEERIDFEFEPASVVVPIIPRAYLHDYGRAKPDADGRSDFERRRPHSGFPRETLTSWRLVSSPAR